ncbi:hypothetical protein [Antrihabitans spumae]|uniref:hypothetical protein n=1 Tax=Antrihabitans spumae TaxID=3373370 RepID=UPI0037524D43
MIDAIRDAGRRRARRLGVRWSSEINGETCGVVVDGNWGLIDLLIARLARDLPTICEATPVSHRSAGERRGLGASFAHIAAQYRFGIADDMQGIVPKLVVRSAPPWTTAPFIFTAPNAPDLERRLLVTERLLVDWEFDEVAPVTMLEELHAAFELTLKRVVWGRYKRQGTFAENVDRAEQLGLLWVPSIRVNRGALRGAEYADTTIKDLLISLKDARNPARHSASDTAERWLNAWAGIAAEVLEALAERAWTKDGAGDPTTGIDHRSPPPKLHGG